MIKTTRTESASTPRLFWIAVAIVAFIILGLYIWIASVDWFAQDDFAFLFYVQQPWSWTRVFFPLENPFWWTYRPLGMDTYFYAAFKLFGWNAQGFFAIAIVTHALTTGMVFRLGRQLGFDIRSAVFAALIAVSRFPSITNLTLACCFHYVAALFFMVLSLSLFLDYRHKSKPVFLLVACVAFLLGLLCNEFVLSLPFLIVLIALYEEPVLFSRVALFRIGLRVLPFFVIAATFAMYRYGIIAGSHRPGFYQFTVSWYVFLNALNILRFVFASRTAYYLGLSIGVVMIMAVGLAKQKPEQIKSTLLRQHMVVLPWLFGMSVVLGALPRAQERFAMTLQIPVALLFAIWLDALLVLYRSKFQRVLEIAIVVLLVVSLPWSQVVARAARPMGAWMRDFQQTIVNAYPNLPDGAVISVLYGGCGRADQRIAGEVNVLGYGPGVLRSIYPDRRIDIRYHDIFREEPRDIFCSTCRYFELLPSREIKALSPRQAAHMVWYAEPVCEPQN